nr:MAG TPA: hypothetical protein [Caudoviricetes sp.]
MLMIDGFNLVTRQLSHHKREIRVLRPSTPRGRLGYYPNA